MGRKENIKIENVRLLGIERIIAISKKEIETLQLQSNLEETLKQIPINHILTNQQFIQEWMKEAGMRKYRILQKTLYIFFY